LLDIFIKYKFDDQYWWTVDERRPVLKKCPAEFYDRRARIEFDGSWFWVPEKHVEYLEYHYGKDWKTPIKEWDFRLDDHCEKEEVQPAAAGQSVLARIKKLLSL